MDILKQKNNSKEKGRMNMVGEGLSQVYYRFKLNFYRKVFYSLQKKEDTLTTIETFFVELIYALDHPTVNEVSRFTGVSQPNVAYKVGNLVKKGFVKKIPSEIDKRKIHLEVTDKFKQYYGVNYEYLEVVSDRIAKRFPKEDVEKLEEMLNIISNELMDEVNDKLERKPCVEPYR